MPKPRATARRTGKATAREVVDRAEPAAVRMVLVVEDDQPIAELLTEAINDEPGYVAVSVPSAIGALQTLETVTPDVMLLDVNLPGLSGLELFDQLQSDARWQDVPVVFQTARDTEHAAELRKRGVAAYLGKPFDLYAAVGMVKRLAPLAARANPPPA